MAEVVNQIARALLDSCVPDVPSDALWRGVEQEAILAGARDAVSNVVWAAAERMMPDPVTSDSPEWTHAAVYRNCIVIAVSVGLEPGPWVVEGRRYGLTWADIGLELGTTRQAAQQRYADAVRGAEEPPS